jgi:hypothetical protein
LVLAERLLLTQSGHRNQNIALLPTKTGTGNLNTSKLADMSEIVSSIAIVVTLIYLTVEVQQNTDALHAQSRQSVLNSGQSELFAMLEYPDIVKSITKKEPLTSDEHVRLNMILVAMMRGREYSWLQYQNGIIDEAQWQTELAVIIFVLDSQRTRDWWEKVGRNAFSYQYSEFVDSLIQNNPPTEVLWKSITNWTVN